MRTILKQVYSKSKIGFAIGWIAAYCVLMSLGDALSETVGLDKSISLAVGLLLSAVLFLFLKGNGLLMDYGLCRSRVSARSVLYYLPLVLLLAANLRYGVTMNLGITETVLYILTMFCVGFLEEVIFRGLLYNAMRGDNPKSAVIVSSITFGIGHILNLFNGSGAELVPNLLQVVYATAAGFLFVMLYCKTGSLIACIVTHGLFNALSAFAPELTVPQQILSCLWLTVVTGSYGLYLALTMKKTGGAA